MPVTRRALGPASLIHFNITNHVNFQSDFYITRYNSTNFGEPTQIIPNSERQAQVGVRFKF